MYMTFLAIIWMETSRKISEADRIVYLTSRSAKEIIPRSTAALIYTKSPLNTNSSKLVMLLLPKIDNEIKSNPYMHVSVFEHFI